MSQIRKRLTYANVMSSIAVFLVLGGATAFAASSLGKNSVGSKQLKNNAVIASKIKNGAVTGAKLNLKTLGTVPSATKADTAQTAQTAQTATTAGTAVSAATANVANSAKSADVSSSVAGETRFAKFVAVGTGPATLVAEGPVTFKGLCKVAAGKLEAEFQVYTNADGASSRLEETFDLEDNPVDYFNESKPIGEKAYETYGSGGKPVVFTGPEGTTVALNDGSIGLGVGGRNLECLFAGIVSRLN